MSKMWIAFAGLGMAGACVLPAFSADVMLNVNTGLWQVTTTGQSSGAPPIPQDDLARLSPEQRAKFEEAMKMALANAATPNTFTECITREQLQSGFKADANNKDTCKQTVTSNTGSVLLVKMDCDEPGQKATGTMRFQAAGPRAVTGTVDVVATNGTRTMTIKNTIQGKWLSADCGTLKPGETRRVP